MKRRDYYNYLILKELEEKRDKGLGFRQLQKEVLSLGSSKTKPISPRLLAGLLVNLIKEGLIEKRAPSGQLRERYYITPRGTSEFQTQTRSGQWAWHFEFDIIDKFYATYEKVNTFSNLSGIPEHENILLGWNKDENTFKILRRFGLREMDINGWKFDEQGFFIEEKKLTTYLNEVKPKDEDALKESVRKFFREYRVLRSTLYPVENLGLGLKPTLSWDAVPLVGVGYPEGELLPIGVSRIGASVKIQLTQHLYVIVPFEYDLNMARAVILAHFHGDISLKQNPNLSWLMLHLGRSKVRKKEEEERHTHIDLHIPFHFGCINMSENELCKELKNLCPYRYSPQGFFDCPILKDELTRSYDHFKQLLPKRPQ